LVRLLLLPFRDCESSHPDDSDGAGEIEKDTSGPFLLGDLSFVLHLDRVCHRAALRGGRLLSFLAGIPPFSTRWFFLCQEQSF